MSAHAFVQGVDIKKFVKIGRPGYRVTKQRDAENGQQSLLFEVTFEFNLSLEKSILLSKKCKYLLIMLCSTKPKLSARHKSLQNQVAIVTQVDYPEIAEGIFPRHRFMSAYEQKVYFCSALHQKNHVGLHLMIIPHPG